MEQFYPDAQLRLIPSATDPAIRPIGVILHVDAGNNYSLYNWFNGPSKGIESHLHVRKDGTVEQYRSFLQEADANYKGNSFIRNGQRVGFISVETQGFFSGKWNDAQLARIQHILTWTANQYGFPLRRCPDPYEPGVGYHVMWGAPGDWTPAKGKTCPGPDRIQQYENVIVPWMEEEMVDRTTKADEGLASLADVFAEAKRLGVATDHTQPGGVAFNDEMLAVLKRLGLFTLAAEVEALRMQVNALSAQSGADRALREHLRAGPR